MYPNFTALEPNKYFEHCQSIMRSDELSTVISEWSQLKCPPIELSGGQKEAMFKAFHNPFQLIQGPPGRECSMIIC